MRVHAGGAASAFSNPTNDGFDVGKRFGARARHYSSPGFCVSGERSVIQFGAHTHARRPHGRAKRTQERKREKKTKQADGRRITVFESRAEPMAAGRKNDN